MAIRHPGEFDLEFTAPGLFDPEVTASGLFDQELEARASVTVGAVPRPTIVKQAVMRSAVR